MRLSELLAESTHTSRDKHSSDSNEWDSKWNPELDDYANLERGKTKKIWDKADGGIPIYTVDEVDPESKMYTNTPEAGEEQSPGYRGEQEVRSVSGAPHKKWDKYNPNSTKSDFPPQY